MPSLKDLKNRIASVKSTRKITSAMKMVAASKFRRAQECAEASRPYARRMEEMLGKLLEHSEFTETTPALIRGTGNDETVLLIVMTSDRGLCGGFNTNIVREARRQIAQLQSEGKNVKLACVGRKGRDQLRRQFGELMIYTREAIRQKHVEFADADDIARSVLKLFDEGTFDIAHIVFNQFKSAMSQVVTVKQLIPVARPEIEAHEDDQKQHAVLDIFEPAAEDIVADLLPRHVSTQLLSCLHESAAGEQGSRMTAMDNATRNAGDMIDRLTQNYNRSRQAHITKELIEIISGAEAL